MALSPKDILSALQWDFLSFFFQGTPPFFLTGGTALSAFYLQHRYSEDLDLFTLDSDAFDRVPLYAAATGTRLNAAVASLQTAPHFHRYRFSRNEESVIVDFVKEIVPQISQAKNKFEGIVVDTLDDIVANKICTVVSRAEIKDYIDLYFLAPDILWKNLSSQRSKKTQAFQKRWWLISFPISDFPKSPTS